MTAASAPARPRMRCGWIAGSSGKALRLSPRVVRWAALGSYLAVEVITRTADLSESHSALPTPDAIRQGSSGTSRPNTEKQGRTGTCPTARSRRLGSVYVGRGRDSADLHGLLSLPPGWGFDVLDVLRDSRHNRRVATAGGAMALSIRDLTVMVSSLLLLASCSAPRETSGTVTVPASNPASPQSETGSPTISSSSKARPNTQTPADPEILTLVHGDAAAFVSPTGNITCLMESASEGADPFVRCDIGRFTFSPPPRPADCDLEWGASLELASSASFSCVGDSIGGLATVDEQNLTSWFLPGYDSLVSNPGPDGVALGYGRALVLGPLRCSSQKSGVSCHNDDNGAAFTVNRSAYSLASSKILPNSTPEGNLAGVLQGEWDGHGRHLLVQRDGTIDVKYRTYEDCEEDASPPCDAVIGGGIALGGSVVLQLLSVTPKGQGGASGTATVISSSDPKQFPVGSIQTFELSDGIIEWAGGTYCGPDAQGDSPCGA